MGRAYSNDLRERVVRAVSKAACRGIRRRPNSEWASARRSTGYSASETGSVKPDQIGGYRPKKITGQTANG